MRDGDIDYSTYTLTELHEAREGINARAWPQNAANLRAELAKRPPEAAAPEGGLAEFQAFFDPPPPAPPPGPYVPNVVSVRERVFTFLISLAILGYAGYGLWHDDLYLPSKHGNGMHLHDRAAWLGAAAMLAGACSMVSTVVDHYDRRDNEASYRMFERFAMAVAIVLLLVAVFSRGATRA